MFCISMVANLVTICWFIFRISQKSQPTCSMAQMADRCVRGTTIGTRFAGLGFLGERGRAAQLISAHASAGLSF